MSRIIVVFFLLSLLEPPFRATWQSPGVARLSWTQPASTTRACLTRIPASGQAVALDCYDSVPPGPVVLLLGATGPVDGMARPQAGDSYALEVGGASERARLAGVVYLGAIRR